jgi:lipopolysaccharide export system protein LptA
MKMRPVRIGVALLLLVGIVGLAAWGWAQEVEKGSDKQAEKAAADAAADATADKQPKPDEAAGTKETKKKAEDDEEDRFELQWADDMFHDKAQHTYYLTGNIVMSHEDVLMYCDEAEYYDKDHPTKPDSARATGNLKIVDPEVTVTGDLLEADLDKKIAVITGNARMVGKQKLDEDKEEGAAAKTGAKPAQETKKDKEPETLEGYAEELTTITCEKITYYYDEDVKRGIAVGNIKAVQEHRTAWADEAIYEGIPEELTLIGNVRLKTDEGDEFRAPRAVIGIEDDWIRAENVSGVTFRREEEEKEKKPPKAEIEAGQKPQGEEGTLAKEAEEAKDNSGDKQKPPEQ